MTPTWLDILPPLATGSLILIMAGIGVAILPWSDQELARTHRAWHAVSKWAVAVVLRALRLVQSWLVDARRRRLHGAAMVRCTPHSTRT